MIFKHKIYFFHLVKFRGAIRISRGTQGLFSLQRWVWEELLLKEAVVHGSVTGFRRFYRGQSYRLIVNCDRNKAGEFMTIQNSSLKNILVSLGSACFCVLLFIFDKNLGNIYQNACSFFSLYLITTTVAQRMGFCRYFVGIGKQGIRYSHLGETQTGLALARYFLLTLYTCVCVYTYISIYTALWKGPGKISFIQNKTKQSSCSTV